MLRLESFLANEKRQSLSTKARFEDTLTESIQFELNVPSSFFSNSTPLFSWRSYTVLCVFPLNIQGCRFSCFFFFSREHDSFNFVSFHTNFERHTQFLIFFFFSEPNDLADITLIVNWASLSVIIRSKSFLQCLYCKLNFFVRPKYFNALWQVGHVTSISFLLIFHEDIVSL